MNYETDITISNECYESGEWVHWRHWHVSPGYSTILTDKVIFLQYYPDVRLALIWVPGNKNTSKVDPITLFKT